MEVWSHTLPHPAKSNKGIFMIAKNKEGKDSSGIVGKLLYFKAVYLCSIHGPRITNKVIQKKTTLYLLATIFSSIEQNVYFQKVPRLVL